jgi:hypothetical protein
LSRYLQAVEARHHHVHDQDPWCEAFGQLHGLEAIADLSDDAEILLGVEQQTQSLAHHVMIIGEYDRQSHVLPCPSEWSTADRHWLPRL